MNKIAAVLLVLVVAAAAWLYFFNGFNQISQQPFFAGQAQKTGAVPLAVQSFEEKNSAALTFISYSDVDYGFSMKYPVGYAIDSSPDQNTYLRIQASHPLTSSEVIDFRVLDGVISESDVNDLVASAPSELLSFKKTVVNGRDAFLFDSTTANADTNETIYVKQAVYSCEKPGEGGGNYSLILVAAVPGSIAEDLDLVDYMIYNVKC